jgi:integral membrane protein
VSDQLGSDPATPSDSSGPPADRSATATALGLIGWGGSERSLSPRSMRAALLRYRIMAYVVGTGLVILACVGVPLQYAGHNDSIVAIVGPIHGFAYIVYLAVGYDMARRVRWSFRQLLPVVLAGFIPGLAFVIERLTTPKIEADIRAFEADEREQQDRARPS